MSFFSVLFLVLSQQEMQAFLVLLTLSRREFPMDLRYSYAVYHAHREERTYQRLGRCNQKRLYLGKK